MNQLQEALIIFLKNIVHGKVKTRLAATIGNDNAIEFYKKLVGHTYSITQQLPVNKIVFYSDFIEPDDIWTCGYHKATQHGLDLGEKMMNAFKAIFHRGYSKAVIIGTDCPALNDNIIKQAFMQLDNHDIVLGPATDGGYYLLGMKTLHEPLFKDIAWSTPGVLDATIAGCVNLNLAYGLLPMLPDVDEEVDLEHMKFIQQ